MSSPLIFLSIPGLRSQDVKTLPSAQKHFCRGATPKRYSVQFPAVTWPAQTTLLTGKAPVDHGILANGIFDREAGHVEMWTSPNQVIEQPQLWDRLSQMEPRRTTAVWFPMLAKECGADLACMPAPVHNPDGSESLWCYTRPSALYGELLDAHGHFPLHQFWGPRAGLPASTWIVRSAVDVARQHRPDFFYLYLPHLDYAAQAHGPDSPQAIAALEELDPLLEELAVGMTSAYNQEVEWIALSEYTIQPVNHVSYPNRRLREAGYLEIDTRDDGEHLNLRQSAAWCLVDHQYSQVFVRDADPAVIANVQDLFHDQEGIAEVLAGEDRGRYGMEHPRCGEVLLISQSDSWQAYYWWFDDALAPAYARNVDIHNKPGYDPVELFWDHEAQGVPLDATRIRGSHGAPIPPESSTAILLTTLPQLFPEEIVHDRDVAERILNWFQANARS